MKSVATISAGTGVLLAALMGVASAAPKIPPYLSAAIADPGRPEADTKRDAYYNPAPVIAFAGVKPGAKVADFLIWDGYYSRIFSKIVGPKGFVYAYYVTQEDGVRPKSGDRVGAEFSASGNVGVIHAPAEQFVTPEPVDIVWIGMSYHDLHNTTLFKGLDAAAVNKAIFATLKPGGTLVVLDRAAKPGSGLPTCVQFPPASVNAPTLTAAVEVIVPLASSVRAPVVLIG